MNKLRTGLIVFAILLIIAQVVLLNFDNLSWKENYGNYLGIASMVLLIYSMIMSNRHDLKSNA